MRGIVLAGGTGSRLGAVTKVVNKHCLLVHDRPMIMWPIKVLRDWGIDDITIVSSEQGISQLYTLLGPRYHYATQESPGGIVDALLCADGPGDVAIILGDNIFARTPQFKRRCYLYEAPKDRLKDFGVPDFEIPSGRILKVIEKPVKPPSIVALTGLYIFPPDVFEVAESIRPSARGETEITDLLNIYADRNDLDYHILQDFWGDAGTFDGIYECSRAMRTYSCES